MDEKQANPTYAVPGAILIAGLIVAGAIYYKGPTVPSDQLAGAGAAVEQGATLETVPAVSPADHLIGNPSAPITIIEYSDLECPFCKTFHQTMQEVIKTYPNEVAWVYRHFPLDQLHRQARPEAEATECAFELGGHEAFWALTDKIFEVTPSNDGLDLTTLPDLAAGVGLDKAAFAACQTSGRTKAAVETQYQEAIAAGARGTPFPVVITPDGKRLALQGAIPFAGMKQLVDSLLAETK